MKKLKLAVGAFLLACGLGFGTLFVGPSAFATTRPTQADLRAATTKIEAVGDYQKFFKDSNAKLTAADTKYYREYNYLHVLVARLAAAQDVYEYMSDSSLNNLLADAHDAAEGCRYLMGIVAAETAAKTPVTQPAANQTTQSVASQTTTQPAAAQTAKPTANQSVQTAKTETATASQTQAAGASSPSPATSDQEVAGSTPAAADSVDVPATGELDTPLPMNLIFLTAGVLGGGAVLSVLLTLAIRREPRRHRY